MIPSENFYERRDRYCKPCEHWRGVCLRGHNLASPAGCPLKKFPPIQGADYAKDHEPAPVQIEQGCCGQNDGMPPLTWTDVVRAFAESVVNWIKAGLPLVGSEQHGLRYGECKKCPHFQGFYCKKCRCIGYLKTKIGSEKCPDQPPRWT